MPPRGTVNCDAETGGLNGRADGQQVLRKDNGTITIGSRTHHAERLPRNANGVPIPAGDIPWRTSRRLQEATLRLIKERDGCTHNNVPVKEEDGFRITESIRLACSPKKPQSEYEPTGEEQEDHPAQLPAEGSGNPSVINTSAAEDGTTSVRAYRKVKRRKVHFNDPLYVFISDKNKDAHKKDVPNPCSSTPATACDRTVGGIVKPTIAGSKIPTNAAMKQPQSCFDLLCSHVSCRGWRCYRSRVAGQAFCVYHLRESTPVAGIWVYT